MSLKVTTEPRENRQLVMTIEVPQERVEKELRRAAAKVAGNYRIPGFRKGKAPYNIVVQQFGLANLYGEFVDDLGQEVYKQAIEQEKIEPYASASLEDVKLDPLVYTLLIPMEPVVTLGDYQSLRIEEETPVVDDTLVDERIDGLAAQYAAWRTVERPSTYGDILTIDVNSVIDNEDGSQTVVLNESDWEVTPDEENPMDPPGFDAELIGLVAGAEKTFSLEWPAGSKSVHAGKTAQFTVLVKDIQAYDKPELNDEFAKLVGPDYNTLEDLRNSIRSTLETSEKSRAENQYLDKALDAIVDISELDYPSTVVEDQMDAMLEEFERRLRMFGIDGLETYFKQIGQKQDEYRESLREEATKVARRNLVLSEIVKVKEFAVSDDEIEERVQAMVGDASRDGLQDTAGLASMMRSPSGRTVLVNQILRNKAIEFVLATVRGLEPEAQTAAETPATPAAETAAPETSADEGAETPAAGG